MKTCWTRRARPSRPGQFEAGSHGPTRSRCWPRWWGTHRRRRKLSSWGRVAAVLRVVRSVLIRAIRAVRWTSPMWWTIAHTIASSSSRTVPSIPRTVRSSSVHAHGPSHRAILPAVGERIRRRLRWHLRRHTGRKSGHRYQTALRTLRHRIISVAHLRWGIRVDPHIVIVRSDRSADHARPSLHRGRLLRHICPMGAVLLQRLPILVVELLLVRRRGRMVLPRRHLVRRLDAEISLIHRGDAGTAPEPGVIQRIFRREPLGRIQT